MKRADFIETTSELEKRREAKVSVIIPCYNYGHFLLDSIVSALAQEGVEVEVVVIDDASSDQTSSIAGAVARQDPRLRLISLPENLGMIGAVNLGLHEITGKYFVKLDADDLLTPGSLHRSVALLERHPEVGFVYGRPRHFKGEAPPRARVARLRWTVWPGAEWLAVRCRRAVGCISQPEAIIRTSTLRMVGAYNDRLPHTSDLEMWLRLAAVSDVGRINGADQGFYRVHPDSMQRTVNAGLLTDFAGRREAFISALSGARGWLRGAAGLEETVRRELAAQALDSACHAFDRDRVEIVPVNELVDFAKATFPAVATLRQWRGLQRRLGRRRRLSKWAPNSLAAAAVRRIRGEVAYARWLRTGI
jgi:hypothetical protein